MLLSELPKELLLTLFDQLFLTRSLLLELLNSRQDSLGHILFGLCYRRLVVWFSKTSSHVLCLDAAPFRDCIDLAIEISCDKAATVAFRQGEAVVFERVGEGALAIRSLPARLKDCLPRRKIKAPGPVAAGSSAKTQMSNLECYNPIEEWVQRNHVPMRE